MYPEELRAEATTAMCRPTLLTAHGQQPEGGGQPGEGGGQPGVGGQLKWKTHIVYRQQNTVQWEERNSHTCYNQDEPRKHDTKQNEPDTKGQVSPLTWSAQKRQTQSNTEVSRSWGDSHLTGTEFLCGMIQNFSNRQWRKLHNTMHVMKAIKTYT